MPFCTQCGKENSDESRFCVDCGTQLIHELHEQEQPEPALQTAPQWPSQPSPWQNQQSFQSPPSEKKSIVKKWWFWVIIGAAILGIIGIVIIASWALQPGEAPSSNPQQNQNQAAELPRLSSLEYLNKEGLVVYKELQDKGYTVTAEFEDTALTRSKGNAGTIFEGLDPNKEDERLSVKTYLVKALTQTQNNVKLTIKLQEEAAQAETDFYKGGMYKIGADMPAGEYVIIGSGYLEIASDSTGAFDSILENDNYKNRTIIKVEDGQYLEFSGKAYTWENAPKVDLSSGSLPEGRYKAGVDFPPGEYKVIPTSSVDGYYQISSAAGDDFDDIDSNKNFSTEQYVTVKEGQYLTLNRASLQLN